MKDTKLLTAMITPYTEDLEVNYAKAEEVAEYLANNGNDGIVVCGTTGESPVLSVEEKVNMYKTVKNKVGDRVKVWAGTGSNYTKGSVELTKNAEKIGVDGIMAVAPYYNKPSQEGMYRHFKAIAESTSLPIMLYNVPGRTSSNLLPETVARLAEIDNILAIKEASGDMDQVSAIKTKTDEKLAIYSGDDSLTLPMLAIGGVGVVSVAAHIVGNEIKSMIEAFDKGETKKALDIHKNLFSIFKGLFITSNPVPVKESLNLMGMNAGSFRLPLIPATKEEKVYLKDLLKKYKKL
ncbi:4-hydroxy-tetrahydrodipicolinate synthase [Candidatus Syntrophocurvum alkaliphilum]|uniref:4-hydroxy-tetrahydrodipicolinate synthase n=1 Tax=Candidatus Syntrophocurvum alkaliphilum TaxID=2293317 RepID=A0A6I6DID9_9FIRM|nr:4-hydroxy-tetrahydrodipicolinate synthase [Candidatus Syntrophocurvum alkaliphilum]QGT99654.1 4-hydroxy-tetrahydrodipicolinate synthase [Candidatus Syntrophocurvum alkaliphilum]